MLKPIVGDPISDGRHASRGVRGTLVIPGFFRDRALLAGHELGPGLGHYSSKEGPPHVRTQAGSRMSRSTGGTAAR